VLVPEAEFDSAYIFGFTDTFFLFLCARDQSSFVVSTCALFPPSVFTHALALGQTSVQIWTLFSALYDMTTPQHAFSDKITEVLMSQMDDDSPRLSGFECNNPNCNSRHKSFATEKAFTIHFQRSPMCFEFFCRDRETLVQPLGHKRVDTSFDDTVVTSSKRSKPLRCHIVNDLSNSVTATFFSAMPTLESKIQVDDNNDAFLDDDVDDMQILMDDKHDIQVLDEDANDEDFACPTQNDIPASSPFLFSTDQKWTISLLKLLDDINAPDYAFASVLTWARNAQADGYSFYPVGGISRTNNVDVLFKSVTNAQRLLPSVKTVDVPHGSPCDVIVYEFAPQLLNLLQNPAVMTAANLLIDLQDPLKPYASPDGRLGDALSGSVYRDAYQRMITNPKRQLFVPIIQWIDRTHVTGNARFSLKPYMFTPAIFKEVFRRKIQAWGYHGFLPKVKLSSAQNQTNMKQGDNIRNYHAQLYAVLSSFTTAGPNLMNVVLPIGPTGMMQVDVVTCILFVIQDMQEGDMLCGRYGTHGKGIQRHSRACNVDHTNLDNPNVNCTFLAANEIADIARNPNAAIRKRWSQHQLNNVFDFVPMADPVRGIYGATPVETMHAFRKGMIEVVTFLVLDNVPPSKLAALDALAIRFHKSHRQTIRKTFPATDFSQGITNLSKISAAERLGLVFLFVILAQYDEGWQILESTLNDNESAVNTPAVNLPAVISVFEAMLCFDQWLNQATYWTAQHHAESKRVVQHAIKTLMAMCVKDIPLAKGKTWKFPKFHELLHILDNMERFGAPINYCAQRPESLLIPVAKKPGRRAQKRHNGSAYELQSAQRLAYSLMINAVYARMWESTATDSHVSIPPDGTLTPDEHFASTGKATFATLTCNASGYLLHWHTQTSVGLLKIPDPVLQFVSHQFGSRVRLCTEFIYQKHTYRCHPSYQSGGAIYDWFNVKYKDKATKTVTIRPCRLATVVITTNAQPLRMVVQCADHATGVKSVLLTEWIMSSDYMIIEPCDVEGPCFVISINDDGSKILQTLPRHLWASEFTTPVDEAKKRVGQAKRS
jgi:Plavaka transposase